MKQKQPKTVQKSESEHGFLRKLKHIFEKNTFEENEKPLVTKQVTKTRKTSITKLGKRRKEYSHATIEQVRKVFKLKKENPLLSNCDISKIVGISEVLIRYYLKKGKTASIKNFKLKEKRHNKLTAKPKITGTAEGQDPRSKEVAEGSKTHPILTEVPDEVQTPKTTPKTDETIYKTADENLDRLLKTEKYPVEHQSDPKYFAESQPPHSVATEEAFAKQKRKNNINRAVVAKKLNQDKKITKENESTNNRKARLREVHKTKEPKIHFDVCPSCNESSNLSVDEYNHIVRQESWRRKVWGEKQRELLEKEKAIDLTKQEPSVAERIMQGTKLCRKCSDRIPYSQATRSYSIYGEYYCGDHMPKL